MRKSYVLQRFLASTNIISNIHAQIDYSDVDVALIYIYYGFFYLRWNGYDGQTEGEERAQL